MKITIEDRVSTIKKLLSETEYVTANDESFSHIDEFNILGGQSIDFSSDVTVINRPNIKEQIAVLNSLYLDENKNEPFGHIQYNISSKIHSVVNDKDLMTLLFAINFASTVEYGVENWETSLNNVFSDDDILEKASLNETLKYLPESDRIKHVRKMIDYEEIIEEVHINYLVSYDVFKKMGKPEIVKDLINNFRELKIANSTMVILCSSTDDELELLSIEDVSSI